METELNEQLSELKSPRWSVVTFDRCAASGLIYEAAADFVAQNKAALPGLCVVTDDTARRMFNDKPDDKMRRERDAHVPAQTTFSDIL